MTKGATHETKPAPKPMIKAANSSTPASPSNSAQVDIPTTLVMTPEGDQLPAAVVADWSEPFELRFGTRTTGYGDVKLQIWCRYLGRQQPAGPDGDRHLFELDPAPGMQELGKPHRRRLDARIIDHSNQSILLDVYNDGTSTIELVDEPSPTKRGTNHIIHTYEHANDLHSWFTLDLVSAKSAAAVAQGPGTLRSADHADAGAETSQADQDFDQLPTSILLAQVLGRLGALKLQYMETLLLALGVANIMKRGARFDEDLPRSTPAGDDPGLRARTRRLLEMLVYLGPIFERLASFANPDAYLAELADDALVEVNRIGALYARALEVAFGPGSENKPFADAEKAMSAFPDWLTALYLSDKRAVPKLIAQVASLEEEYRSWFDANNEWANRTPGYRTPEEQVTRVRDYGGIARSSELAETRDKIEQAWRDEKPDILDRIADFYADIQIDIALLTAMVVQLQVASLSRALGDSLTNDVIDVLPFTRNRERQADNDYTKVQQLVDQLVGVYGENGGEARRKLAQEALARTADVLKEISGDLEDFQNRLKWVNRINLVGKLLVIVAAAALTGGAAGSVAFAGFRAAGVGLGYALAGEALVGGFVFTVTSRIGNRILIGGPEGRFVSEWFWNSLTLGFLKLVNAGYAKIFELPETAGKFAKMSFGLGNAATAMVSLHGFGELQYLITQGKWMSGDERIDAIFQNVALMVGMEAGRFITEPLQKRMTEAIVSKIAAKLGERVMLLDGRRAALKSVLASMARGEASPGEIRQIFEEIEGLWHDELELLVNAAKGGVIDPVELEVSLAAYREHIAAMELRLSQLDIKPPSGGPKVFRPLARGFVAFAPEGRAQLEKFYDPNDPVTPGKSLSESKTIPGVLEGRLPTGELTYYVPEGTFPPGVQTGHGVVAARDAAVLVVQGDPVAKQGLDRLEAGLAGGKAPPLEGRMIDELLSMVAPEHVHAFLRALADPAFTSDLPFTFYTELAGRPRMVEFAHGYGGDLVVKFYDHFGWSSECEQAVETARWRLETAATADARAALLAELRAASPAALDQLAVDSKTLIKTTAEEALGPQRGGEAHPQIEIVPRSQLGGSRVAKAIVERGRVTKILIDEKASPAAVREEVRHVMQARDPEMAHLFAQVDLGKPYADYTPREKLAAHKAAVAIELADKMSLIAELHDQQGPLASSELLRALDDVNSLRQKQLDLVRLDERGLSEKDLPGELRDPAGLHAKRTIAGLRSDPQWSKLSLGDFRAKFLKENQLTTLTYGEIESYYQRFRLYLSDSIPGSAKFDTLAKLGPSADLPLTTRGSRRKDALLISDAEQAQLDKLLASRDAARRRRNEGLEANDDAAYKRWDQKVREASHEIGERALDTWAKQRAWQDNARPSLYYRAESSRSGDFDAIHTWDRGPVRVYLVGEGKGAGAELGGKWIGGDYVQQGSKEYFEAVAEAMAYGHDAAAKKAGTNLLSIMNRGVDLDGHLAEIQYEKVQVPVKYESAPRMKMGERSTASRFVITPFKI